MLSMSLMAHPNRSRRIDAPGRNPSWEEVRAAREATGLTQSECARRAFVTLSAWQRWELKPGPGDTSDNSRRMPAAAWWCFRLATGQATLDQLLAAFETIAE